MFNPPRRGGVAGLNETDARSELATSRLARMRAAPFSGRLGRPFFLALATRFIEASWTIPPVLCGGCHAIAAQADAMSPALPRLTLDASQPHIAPRNDKRVRYGRQF